MAQQKAMALGVLNIKTQPNSPENYLKLFNYLFKVKPLVQIRGADYGTPFSYHAAKSGKPLDGIVGTFYKYLEIDPTKPWLNLETHETIVNEDGVPIPQVANNKRPNTKELSFAFYPRGHRFFFDHKVISPNMAQKFLAGLFSDEKIKKKFGLVDVEIETSIEAIERILKIPTITKLNIYFTRPNGDDHAEIEEKFLKRIAEQKARKLELLLTSDKDDGLEPDAETIAMMNVAVSNGEVVAEGFSGDDKVIESTEHHPFIHRELYDRNRHTFFAAMYNISSGLLDRFTNQKGE